MAFDFSAFNAIDADANAWATYKAAPTKQNYNSILSLAGKTGHTKAKNYAGCIIASKTKDAEKLRLALGYFESADKTDSLALYNSGLMLTFLKVDPAKALDRIQRAYKQQGFEEAGAQILIAGYKKGQLDQKVLEEMLVLRSPIAFYMKAYLLYTQAQLKQALTFSSQGAEMGDLNSIALQAIIYKGLSGFDASNTKPALTWQYISKMMANPSAGRASISVAVTVEDLAWNEAVNWVAHHEVMERDYGEPLCEAKKLIYRPPF